jgi:outer membrane lipase/esterase
MRLRFLRFWPLLLLMVSLYAHAAYTETYFFGDSLTDAGSFSTSLPPGTGKFTTNPGPVWSEDLAAQLDTHANPAVTGGTDYAQGGARVIGRPGVDDDNPLTANALPVHEQISAYLAKTPQADPEALYVIWAGANDIFRAIDASKPESAQPQAYMTETAKQLVQEVLRLQAAGARYFMIGAVPDIGITPFGRTLAPKQAQSVSLLVGIYNAAVVKDLLAAHVKFMWLDAFNLLHKAVRKPQTYGFMDVTDPACGDISSLVCTEADWVAANADETYLFADGVHPTSAGHHLLAERAMTIIKRHQFYQQAAQTLKPLAALLPAPQRDAAAGAATSP